MSKSEDNDFFFNRKLPVVYWTDIKYGTQCFLNIYIYDVTHPLCARENPDCYYRFKVKLLDKVLFLSDECRIEKNEIFNLDIPISSFRRAWINNRIKQLNKETIYDFKVNLKRLSERVVRFVDYELIETKSEKLNPEIK